MENAIKLLSSYTVEQIQALPKKETSLLIYSIIKVCEHLVTNLNCLTQVNDKLNVLYEVKSTTSDISEEVASLNNRVNVLKSAKNEVPDTNLSKLQQLEQRLKDSISELESLDQGQVYNQKLLEEMDAASRKNNLIITGVPEENVHTDLGTKDIERVENIVLKTGITVHRNNLRIRRLGQVAERARPILVTLDCHNTCREIRINANKLKEVSNCANIFIRKDVHPTLRHEANRLRIKEREEKEKPENIGAHIVYDRKERVLLRDGMIIDRFRPSFK